MKVFQLLTTVSFGDAVSNDTIAIHDILRKSGYDTGIYAENIDNRLPKGLVTDYRRMPSLNKNDVVIYHLSTGSELNNLIKSISCRKIMIYHNITPPDFFNEYSRTSYELCKKGLEQAEALKDTFEYVLADSEFNKQDLIHMGYKCPIHVLPILIKFDDYAKRPNKITLKKYEDDYTNILFVGRIAPNKKQENVIESFYYYNKYYNSKSRLFIVGSYGGMELYYKRLQDYVKELKVPNVVFPGHIKFDEILAYYHLSDCFVCMSEHEGFCVPLVEAMYFDVPIIAYDSCAISGTLGNCGILFQEKEPLLVAGLIDKITRDRELKNKVLESQRERLKDFDNMLIQEQFIQFMKEI